MELSSDQIDELIRQVAENGKLTLDLAKIVKGALKRSRPSGTEGAEEERQGQPVQEEEAGLGSEGYFAPFEEDEIELVEIPAPESQKRAKVSDGVTEGESESSADSDAAESEEFLARGYGINGWGRPPKPQFDKSKISREQEREIRRNPLDFIEFVYENRRFKLTPIGTIEPVAKRIYFGPSLAPYYYKTRGPNGEKLPIGRWTKIYLKDYQKKQCFQGRSERAIGLAGYIDVNGACLNRPRPNGRTTAARESRTRPSARPMAAASAVRRRHKKKNK